MANLTTLKRIGKWIFTGFRILIGLLVTKTGIDLMRGGTLTGYNKENTLLTGGFVMIIGLYFIFSSLIHALLIDDIQGK